MVCCDLRQRSTIGQTETIGRDGSAWPRRSIVTNDDVRVVKSARRHLKGDYEDGSRFGAATCQGRHGTKTMVLAISWPDVETKKGDGSGFSQKASTSLSTRRSVYTCRSRASF